MQNAQDTMRPNRFFSFKTFQEFSNLLPTLFVLNHLILKYSNQNLTTKYGEGYVVEQKYMVVHFCYSDVCSNHLQLDLISLLVNFSFILGQIVT